MHFHFVQLQIIFHKIVRNVQCDNITKQMPQTSHSCTNVKILLLYLASLPRFWVLWKGSLSWFFELQLWQLHPRGNSLPKAWHAALLQCKHPLLLFGRLCWFMGLFDLFNVPCLWLHILYSSHSRCKQTHHMLFNHSHPPCYQSLPIAVEQLWFMLQS